MTFEYRARQNKAIAIEMILRADGVISTEELDALTADQRQAYVKAAGLVGASADTWGMIRDFFTDYDKGRYADSS